jgi:hypothetical protein
MRTVLVMPAVLSATLMATAAAQLDSKASRATLAGLPGFFVSVEDMDSTAERVGVTARVIQQDVESRLTSAGIRLTARRRGCSPTTPPRKCGRRSN